MFAVPSYRRRRRQHREDRRVRMVEADRPDRAERREVVLHGVVVAVPGDDVERALPDRRLVEATAPLHRHRRRRLPILERGDRRLEVAPVGQAVRADRPALRQRETLSVVLADEAAGGPLHELDRVDETARQERDLAGDDVEHAELGAKAQRPRLRHDEELGVGRLEVGVLHRRGDEVDVARHAALHRDVAGRRHRAHAREPGQRLLGVRDRVPAVLPEGGDVLRARAARSSSTAARRIGSARSDAPKGGCGSTTCARCGARAP